jgi:hypothetical protein
MNLQRALDSLRLVLECKALGNYMGIIRWLLVYIYIQIVLTCSTTFRQILNSCTTQLYYL